MGAYESLDIVMRPFGSLWVLIGSYASLCVFLSSL